MGIKFKGTIDELCKYLESLPKGMTVREYLDTHHAPQLRA